jgi:hypothetical protein
MGAIMPRYFYHIVDGKALVDLEGTEVGNLADARAQAIDTAGRMLSEMDGQFWGDGRAWTMSVADETGRVVFTLKFSADDHGVHSEPTRTRVDRRYRSP